MRIQYAIGSFLIGFFLVGCGDLSERDVNREGIDMKEKRAGFPEYYEQLSKREKDIFMRIALGYYDPFSEDAKYVGLEEAENILRLHGHREKADELRKLSLWERRQFEKKLDVMETLNKEKRVLFNNSVNNN